jgi:GNAT superfamily N-acetyltransferase
MTEDHDIDIGISEHAGLVVLVACDRTGDAVGWASLDLHPAPGEDNVDIQVLAHRRGYGYGYLLLEALLAEARRRGVPFLRRTHPDDVVARRLLGHGGVICSRKVVDGTSKDVVVVPAA